jgi:deoxyribodipyrimidine photo-lyase
MPQEVLLTIDSLGDSDAALQAHPDLPVVFIFHEPKLHKLQLSSKRIAFYLETLKDLSARRNLKVLLGDRDHYAQEVAVAVTWAPVPSFAPLAGTAAELHPWPWLADPHGGSIKSFSAWRNKARVT